MNWKKRISGAVTAAVMSVGVCLSGTASQAVSAAGKVPGYDNVDNYVADCLINGYISLETGEYEGAGFYNLEDPGLYIFEKVSESIMEQSEITDPSDLGSLSAELPGGLTKTQLYELLLADYFNFETQDSSYSEHNEALLTAKEQKFRDQLLKELVKSGAAASEEAAKKLVESTATADNKKAVDALKKLGCEKKLSGYTNVLSNISKASGKASSYFDALATALALEELNTDKTELLAAMVQTAGGNADFIKAAEKFSAAMVKSYGQINLSDGSKKIADYAVVKAWESVKSGISGLAAASADQALDSLFNSGDPAIAQMRLLLQYSVNGYAKDAVIGFCDAFESSAKSEAAEDFHSAFANYVLYQEYSSAKTAELGDPAEDEEIIGNLVNESASFHTESVLINKWYENYLAYTGVKSTEDGVPEGAVEYNGHYYMVFNNSISWVYAKEYCELMGGHLATVADEKEQEVVEKVAEDCKGAENFWIGGYCSKKDVTKWMWVDGTPFEYTNWDDKQPDYHESNEYYIRFTNKDINYENWTAAKGKWNDCANEASGNNSKGDAVSIQTFAFICEWDDLESLQEGLLGDANGDGKVNVRDAAHIAKLLAQGKASELTSIADFNGDGKVNVRDAAAIAKFLATGKK